MKELGVGTLRDGVALLPASDDHYKKLQLREDAVEAYRESADRTPELGILNATTQAITSSQVVVSPKTPGGPRLEPRTHRVAIAVPAAPNRKKRRATASYSWFAAKDVKTAVTQLLWSVVGVLAILAIIWAISQRDEEETQKSGKWFQEQLYKFAPHKFENEK